MTAHVLNFPTNITGARAIGLDIATYLVREMEPLEPGDAPEDSPPDEALRGEVAKRWGHLSIADLWGIVEYTQTPPGNDWSDPLQYLQDWLANGFDDFIIDAPARTPADATARVRWLAYFLASYDAPDVLTRTTQAIERDLLAFGRHGEGWVNPDPAATLGGWWDLDGHTTTHHWGDGQ